MALFPSIQAIKNTFTTYGNQHFLLNCRYNVIWQALIQLLPIRDVRSTLESYPRRSREYFAELRKDLDYIADRAEQYNHIDRESQPNGDNTNHARANTERIRNIVEIARDAKERSTIRDELNRLSERGSEFISEFRSRVQGIVQYIWDRAERAERERLEAERARVQPVQPKPNAPKFRM